MTPFILSPWWFILTMAGGIIAGGWTILKLDGIRTARVVLLFTLAVLTLTVLAPFVFAQTSYVARPDGTLDSGGWEVTGVEGVRSDRPAYSLDTTGLVLSYDMDTLSGSDLADFSGNGLDGTLTGVVASNGVFGGAYDFDDGADEVSVSDPGSSPLDLATVSFGGWFHYDSTNPDSFITAVSKSPAGNYALYFRNSDEHAYLQWDNGAGSQTCISDDALVGDAWNHVFGYISDGNQTIWVGGSSTSCTVSGPLTQGNSALLIGTDLGQGSGRDAVDEFLIFGREVTDAEVSSLMILSMHEPTDEVAQDGNTTYINTTATSVANVTLSDIADPVTDANHTLTFIALGTSAHLVLRQGTMTISDLGNTSLTPAYAAYSVTLDTAAVASITDYRSLTVQLEGFNASITQVFLEISSVPQVPLWYTGNGTFFLLGLFVLLVLVVLGAILHPMSFLLAGIIGFFLTMLVNDIAGSTWLNAGMVFASIALLAAGAFGSKREFGF